MTNGIICRCAEHFNRSFSLRSDACGTVSVEWFVVRLRSIAVPLSEALSLSSLHKYFHLLSKAGSLLVARLLNSSLNFNSTRVGGTNRGVMRWDLSLYSTLCESYHTWQWFGKMEVLKHAEPERRWRSETSQRHCTPKVRKA